MVESEIMSVLLDLLKESVGLYLATMLLSVGFNVATMLAIGYDCKAKAVKSRTTYMVLAFFFPIIVTIVYLCNKSKYNLAAAEMEIPDRESNSKKRKTCVIIAIVLYVCATILGSVFGFNVSTKIIELAESPEFSEEMDEMFSDFEDMLDIRYGFEVDGEKVYYDMKGNAYKTGEEVPFYDKDGNAFIYKETEEFDCYLVNGETKYDYYYCYVTPEGYLIYDKNDSFEIVDENFDGATKYNDNSGNPCYSATDISWDADGNLITSFDGKLVK